MIGTDTIFDYNIANTPFQREFSDIKKEVFDPIKGEINSSR